MKREGKNMNKEDINKEKLNKEDINKEKLNKEDINKEDIKIEWNALDEGWKEDYEETYGHLFGFIPLLLENP